MPHSISKRCGCRTRSTADDGTSTTTKQLGASRPQLKRTDDLLSGAHHGHDRHHPHDC
jgi:hypothetical protein